MARKKISEFKAKQILSSLLQTSFNGLQITSSNYSDIESLNPNKKYVIKVDQGVKGRMKKGLVIVDVSKEIIKEKLDELSQKGYSQFLIEEYIDHDIDAEQFISMERVREGIKVYYSNQGGIHIENNKDTIKETILNDESKQDICNALHISSEFLNTLEKVFNDYYFSFLEINPLIIIDNTVYLLDLAVEVDSAGEFFVKNEWTKNDYVEEQKQTVEEQAVEQLRNSSKSQASFSLTTLNKNGSIFLLLSGGGASLVLADELYNLGFGPQIANYGEYSGNPTTQETYEYTQHILNILFKSESQNKILIIAGGVANFTDIRKTFTGVIKALEEVKDTLKQQQVKIFVRRGGPFEKEGLSLMKQFLEQADLEGSVHGSEIILTQIIKEAINS